MPVADPVLTVDVAAIGWDVLVSVDIREGVTARPARAGEVEVILYDIGEIILDRTVYNQTGRVKTNAQGRVRFNYSAYPWLVGYDGVWGANRVSLSARLVGVTPEIVVVKDLRLGTTSWEDPPSDEEAGVVEGGVRGFPG